MARRQVDDGDEDESESAERRRAKPARLSRRPARPAPDMTKWVLLGTAGAMGLVIFCCAGLFFLARLNDRGRPQPPQGVTPWGEYAAIGPVRIKVESVAIAQYTGTSPSGEPRISKNPAIILVIRIQVDSNAAPQTIKGAAADATLKGDIWHVARVGLKTDIGLDCDIDGQISVRQPRIVEPGKETTDALFFDRPRDNIEPLILTLNARHYGGVGDARFDIPDRLWRPAKPPK